MREKSPRYALQAFGAVLVLLLLAMLGAAPAFAQQTVVEIDPHQTEVTFTLGAALHTVHGTFQLKRGKIAFDPDTGQAGGEVVIDATSGDTGNRSRDSKMHREVLQSEMYPEMTFTPVQVEGNIAPDGDCQVVVKGLLRLHGGDHEVMLPTQVHIAAGRMTADASVSIPYVKWGLKNPSTFILRVSETLQVHLHVSGSFTTASATPAAN